MKKLLMVVLLTHREAKEEAGGVLEDTGRLLRELEMILYQP